MNFIRSRLSVCSLLGRRCSPAAERLSYRGMCNKPQEVKSQPPPAVPTPEPRPAFRLPGYKPSDLDKKILIWTGRFKTVEQIPETVSFEMLDAARNKIRVKAAYLMMAITIGACLVTVFFGKRAARRNESLTSHNMEKKARWREEVQRERENALALAEKPQ
ncbi:protein FAM162B [Salarias fasciatus]|uniref:Protein FAM162B-like n=1 Tax=Salarias fasciatus TaxID=181472 RepID=A0A672GBF7_SALFA|nr:protein FAM162B-like [Salarias fasciatus]